MMKVTATTPVQASITGINASLDKDHNGLLFLLTWICEENAKDVFQRLTEDVPLDGIYYKTSIAPLNYHPLPVESKVILPLNTLKKLRANVLSSSLLSDEDKNDILQLWGSQQALNSSLVTHDTGHLGTLTPTNSFGEVANFVQGITFPVLSFKKELEESSLTKNEKRERTTQFITALLNESFTAQELGLVGETLPHAAKNTNGFYYVQQVFSEYKGDLGSVVQQWLTVLKTAPTLVTKINQTAANAQQFIHTQAQGNITAEYTLEVTEKGLVGWNNEARETQ
jgi:hypothetical protein